MTLQRKRIDRELIVLLLAAFALRLAAAVLLPNIYHPDEIFQSLEPAFRSLTGFGIETWEWREGIRSWVVAGFFRQLIAAFSIFDVARGTLLTLIAATLSLLSLAIVWAGYRTGDAVFGREAGLAIGVLCAVWPDFILMGSKPLTEAMAADALVLAAFLADRACRATAPRFRTLIGIGVLLGLAFCLRFHIAFALAVIAVWVCRVEFRRRWLPLLAGAALPLVLSGLIDMFTWGLPFQPIWKNFWINIVEDKSTSFGTKPPWFYLTKPVAAWGIAIVPILYGLWRGTRYRPMFALCALTIWVSFSPISHKEMRFLFPAIPLVIIVAGLGCWGFLHEQLRIGSMRRMAAVFAGGWMALAILASTLFGFSEYWTRNREPLLLLRELRTRTDVCGLGLINMHWAEPGGYTHLGKDVPYHTYGDSNLGQTWVRTFDADPGAFNYAISRGIGPLSPHFSLLRCINEICLQRRDGTCSSDPRNELQRLLRNAGQ